MNNLSRRISETKEGKHRKRLKKVSERTIKEFLEQQTQRRIRRIWHYIDEPLRANIDNIPVPDIIVVYLADTFRLAFIEVKTSHRHRCTDNLNDQITNIESQIAQRTNISTYLKAKDYPQGVIDSIFQKGIEVYGARITASSGLVRIFDWY